MQFPPRRTDPTGGPKRAPPAGRVRQDLAAEGSLETSRSDTVRPSSW